MDNKDLKKPQDSKRINIHEAYEVEYWTKTLGISKAELEKAVKSAGVGVEEVKAYLEKK